MNAKSRAEHFDQFGGSEIRRHDFARWAAHMIADDAAAGLSDAPAAAIAADSGRARGFLRQLPGLWITHLILFIVSFATIVNSHSSKHIKAYGGFKKSSCSPEGKPAQNPKHCELKGFGQQKQSLP